MLPSSLRAKRSAACSTLLNWYDVVRCSLHAQRSAAVRVQAPRNETERPGAAHGTPREPVPSPSIGYPPWIASVAMSGSWRTITRLVPTGEATCDALDPGSIGELALHWQASYM